MPLNNVAADRVGADSVLAPLERRLLASIARRLPAFVKPDHLTLFGFFGAFVVFACGVLSNTSPLYLVLGIIGIVMNWLGDSLDGTLARLRRIERPNYGFFVDHGCDVFSIVLIGVGAGVSPYFDFGIAMAGIVGYLVFMVCALLRQRVRGYLQIAYAGVGPTEFRLFLIIMIGSYLIWPPYLVSFSGEWSFYLREALVMAMVAIELLLLFTFMLVEARAIAATDPLPFTEAGPASVVEFHAVHTANTRKRAP